MLVKIVGWFWIIMGVLFLLKADFFRRRLQKKSYKRVRRLLFAMALALGILLISWAWKLESLLPKIVIFLGIIAIFKGFFLLKAKAAEKIIEWFSRQPLAFFRWLALAYVAIGIIILWGFGR